MENVRLAYQTDVNDKAWEVIEKMLPQKKSTIGRRVHSPKGGWRLKSRLWVPSGRMSAYADTDHPSAQADAQP